MPAKPKFTRIPKMRDLMEAGVPAEAIPTYCALTDYANNKTGLLSLLTALPWLDRLTAARGCRLPSGEGLGRGKISP